MHALRFNSQRHFPHNKETISFVFSFFIGLPYFLIFLFSLLLDWANGYGCKYGVLYIASIYKISMYQEWARVFMRRGRRWCLMWLCIFKGKAWALFHLFFVSGWLCYSFEKRKPPSSLLLLRKCKALFFYNLQTISYSIHHTKLPVWKYNREKKKGLPLSKTYAADIVCIHMRWPQPKF